MPGLQQVTDDVQHYLLVCVQLSIRTRKQLLWVWGPTTGSWANTKWAKQAKVASIKQRLMQPRLPTEADILHALLPIGGTAYVCLANCH